MTPEAKPATPRRASTAGRQAAEKIIRYVAQFARPLEFGYTKHLDYIASEIDAATAKLREEVARLNQHIDKLIANAARTEQERDDATAKLRELLRTVYPSVGSTRMRKLIDQTLSPEEPATTNERDKK